MLAWLDVLALSIPKWSNFSTQGNEARGDPHWSCIASELGYKVRGTKYNEMIREYVAVDLEILNAS